MPPHKCVWYFVVLRVRLLRVPTNDQSLVSQSIYPSINHVLVD